MRYRLGEFELDTDRERLSGPAGALVLRPQAYRLLLLLVQRAPALVARDELMDVLWGHHALSPNVIPQTVSELRQALGDDPQASRYVETRHRRGYAFVAPIQVLDDAPPPGQVADVAPEAAETSDAAVSVVVAPPPSTAAAPRPDRRSRVLAWVLAVLALGAIGFAWTWFPARVVETRVVAVPTPKGAGILVSLNVDDPRLRAYLVGFARGNHAWHAYPRPLQPSVGWSLSVTREGQWSLRAPGGEVRSSGDLPRTDAPSQASALLQAMAAGVGRNELVEAPPGWPTARDVRTTLMEAAWAMSEGLHADADAAFDALQAAGEVSGWPRLSLVEHLVAVGRWKAAERELSLLDPGPDRMLQLQREVWRARLAGRPDDALASLRAAALLAPGDITIQLDLFDALIAQSQWHAAAAQWSVLPALLADNAPELAWRRAEYLAVAAPGDAEVAFRHAVTVARMASDREVALLAQVRWMIHRSALKDAAEVLDALDGGHAAVQMQRAEWAMATGQMDLARASFQTAEAAWTSDQRSGDARRARLGLIDVALQSGQSDMAVRLATRLLADAATEGDRDIEIDALDAMGRAWIGASRFDDARASLQQAMTLARARGQGLREARARYHLGNAYAQERQRPHEAEQAYRLAADAFHLLGDRLWEVKALSNLALMAERAGRRLDARDAYRDALLRIRELGVPRELGRIGFNAGINERDMGDLSAAAVLIDEALSVLSAAGAGDVQVVAVAARADIAMMQADARLAESLLNGTRERAEQAAPLPRSVWHSAQARRFELAGDLDRARTELDRVAELRQATSVRTAQLDGELSRLRLRVATGDASRATGVALERIEDELRRMGETKYSLSAALGRVEWALAADTNAAQARNLMDALRPQIQSAGNRAQQLRLDWLAAHAVEGDERSSRLHALIDDADASHFELLSMLARRAVAEDEATRARIDRALAERRLSGAVRSPLSVF